MPSGTRSLWWFSAGRIWLKMPGMTGLELLAKVARLQPNAGRLLITGWAEAVSDEQIEDLSHTYARDENPRILEWFDPLLALEDAARA